MWIIQVFQATASKPCVPRNYGKGSYVCVCNSTYCDTVEPNIKVQKGSYSIYVSSKAGDRFKRNSNTFKSSLNSSDDVVFTVFKNHTFQRILGFGGAFTDAAGINIASLSADTQTNLLKSYYSPEGIEYSLGRVPMASCDFSTRPYSYDDSPGDFDLKNFSLAMEDLKYKIPFIQKAMAMSRRNIPIFGSPWSAPAWMKTNQNMTGKGTLIGSPGGKYYKTWANYFIKFLQAYESHGIHVWGLTAENEPTMGLRTDYLFQAMGFTAEMQRDFIAQDLGPALWDNGYKNVKLMILDDMRLMLPGWAETILQFPEAAKYVSGVGVHWYTDFIVPIIGVDKTHESFPDKFILSTEACEGSLPFESRSPQLGSWDRGESYAHSIIEDLNHWIVGWTDWNIALDLQGGPNWVKNFVDSPIIVNAAKDEFYKQPMYYVLGHFSKFLPNGSKRIAVKGNKSTKLETVGFMLADSSIVMVVSNREDDAIGYHIYDPTIGYINLVAEPHSIQTIIWWSS
ncbi:unnamed protein product [Owenia fusiformis]|uniref:Glucosylceramidase n=1 Tax=Owenia fusiformis TaxID=6347 RepID=A0A8S4Q2K8_OWEFU|nr:unnamed protein product [Owenia fusiformis]